ncbi:MAG: hypothetical protein KatS3mg038_2104 [Candidatus Kapaibacterium sp.]|nr:MAG: hypothetical protein KatS3mg038_2104 [Candidatus Kapabacteria bacterium]
MARYLLNSAVITAPGLYRYSLIDVEQAKRWLDAGDPPLSTIRYEQTAVALGMLVERPIEVCDLTIEMFPRDEALVFRLVLPPGTPRIDPHNKGRLQEELRRGNWELGLLERIA